MLPVWERQLWKTPAVRGSGQTMSLRGMESTSPALVRYDSSSPLELPEMESGCAQRLISYPSSPVRVVWDLIGAVLILYDLFLIPIQVFEPAETDSSIAIEWFTLVFWTLNVFCSFFVGYVKDGVTIMSPKKIAINYVKTWFVVDLVVVVPDWAFSLASIGQDKRSAGSSVRLLRILRLMRMVRLLRLLKLRKTLRNINDLIDTEYASIVANIVKMILLLLVINHYIACAWYFVGVSLNPDLDTWVRYHGFEEAEWGYQYLTAFHWSITQFTPASMSVQPQNIHERMFAINVVVFALVGFSYVVGSITGSLTQLRSMQEDTTKQFWNLRRYLKQNKVPLTLASRIQRYLEHAWQSQQENISLQNIKIMKLLSEQLHCELQCELSVPHLSVHPLFRRLYDVSNVTMHRLANTAIRRKPLARNDILFISGEKATNMYIVVAGRLQYHKSDSSGDDHHEWVDKGEDWIAEPVLWTPMWLHLGNLTAVTECDLLLVDPKSFSEVFVLNPHAYTLASNYAQRFLMWLESLGADSLTDICQGEEVGPLVESFIDSYTEPMSQTCSSQSATSQHDTWAGRVPSASRRKAVMFWRRGGTC